ncbi:hypothetical protein D3C80_1588140 [compost metagenome]
MATSFRLLRAKAAVPLIISRKEATRHAISTTRSLRPSDSATALDGTDCMTIDISEAWAEVARPAAMVTITVRAAIAIHNENNVLRVLTRCAVC